MSASDLVTDEEEPDVSEADRLRGRVEQLRQENEQLREEYARAKRSQYRQSAATLATVGVLALIAGVVVASARTVLFALGGTGVFLGVLTYYLTPEQFLPVSVGETVYSTLAENGGKLVATLGLSDHRVYRPPGPDGEAVRLFVPQHAEYTVPEAGDEAVVVSESSRERGLLLAPTGEPLYAEFQRAVVGDPETDPTAVAGQLADALVEQFELAESATPEGDQNRVAVRVTGSQFGAVDRFDHPVASLIGVGVARAVGEPVRVTVDRAGDDAFVVACSWDDAPE
jgi:hypothetical protein